MFSILTVTITIDLSRPAGAEDSKISAQHLFATETQFPGVSGQFWSAGPLAEEASAEEEEVDPLVWAGGGNY